MKMGFRASSNGVWLFEQELNNVSCFEAMYYDIDKAYRTFIKECLDKGIEYPTCEKVVIDLFMNNEKDQKTMKEIYRIKDIAYAKECAEWGVEKPHDDSKMCPFTGEITYV